MDSNSALTDLASCRTRLIGAPLFRRVHRLCCGALHTHIMPMASAFFKLSPQFHQLVGLYLPALYENITEIIHTGTKPDREELIA